LSCFEFSKKLSNFDFKDNLKFHTSESELNSFNLATSQEFTETSLTFILSKSESNEASLEIRAYSYRSQLPTNLIIKVE